MDLQEYYEEVTKTAGLKAAPETEVEVSEEKIAAVVAVVEQFGIDGIEFDSEDEKIAAATAIVNGFEATLEETDKEAGIKAKAAEMAAKVKGHISAAAAKVKEKGKAGYDAAKAHLMKHKNKYQVGGAGAAGAGLGFAAGRKSKD